jgi:MFS family permease
MIFSHNMADTYYHQTPEGIQSGPVDRATLMRWQREGRLTVHSLLRAEGTSEWAPASRYLSFPTAPHALADLRPLTTGELIDRIFQLYRRHFVKLFLFASILYSINFFSSIGFAWLGIPKDIAAYVSHPATYLNLGLLLFLSVIPVVLGNAALTVFVSELYLGRDAVLGDVLKPLRGRIVAILWTGLLSSSLIILSCVPMGLALGAAYYSGVVLRQIWIAPGFLLLALLFAAPPLILFVRYWLARPIVMFEGKSGWPALARSSELSRYDGGLGFWYWGGTRISILLLIFFVISMLVGIVSGAPQVAVNIADYARGVASPRDFALSPVVVLTQLLNYIGSALVGPLYIIAGVLLYYDIRIRREGFDLEIMADSLTPPEK